MRRLAKKEVEAEIAAAEMVLNEPDGRAIRFWERIRIPPERWEQNQYPGDGRYWVVAILGSRCLYLNEVEGGWGWGRFERWGQISDHHWQQDEIEVPVFQTLFAIDEGGDG